MVVNILHTCISVESMNYTVDCLHCVLYVNFLLTIGFQNESRREIN
jgi:hypothetical protein